VSEASAYYQQFADQMLRANNAKEAAAAYRKAFDCGQENVKFLEQMADALLVEGDSARAAEVLREAAEHWKTRGQANDARRCLDRANVADPATRARAGRTAGPLAIAGGPLAASARWAPRGLRDRPHLDLRLEPAGPAAHGADAGVLSGSRIGIPQESTPSGFAADDFERPSPFMAPPPPAANVPAPVEEEPAVPAEGVYDIGSDSGNSYEHALSEVQTPPPPAVDPYARRGFEDVPSPSVVARRPVLPGSGVVRVESLLQQAQDEFRSGDRVAASQALVEAAQAYEALGRLDSAATIFRSLGRGAHAPIGVMELWLANCEKRGDQLEGSQVACEPATARSTRARTRAPWAGSSTRRRSTPRTTPRAGGSSACRASRQGVRPRRPRTASRRAASRSRWAAPRR
jgi:tetratricopeptide (TPR) repeat protein